MLSKKEFYVVKCDECGLEASEPQTKQYDAEKIATDNGWEYFIDGRYFCPDCFVRLKKKDELIDAQNLLRSYCLSRKTCSRCFFKDREKNKCGLINRPKKWIRVKGAYS